MKNYLKLLIILLLFSSLTVYAKSNRVSIVSYKDNIYYNQDVIQEEDFSKEINLSKESSKTMEFTIDNTMKKEQEVFLLIDTVGEDGSYNELLDYLNVTIKVDDKEIYHGSLEQMNHSTSEDQLREFISIGKVPGRDLVKLTIDVQVSNEYKSISNNRYSYIYCSFYRRDKNKNYLEIEGIASEELYNVLDVWVFSIVSAVIAFIGIIVLYFHYRRKGKPKKEKKKKKEKEEEKK
jgi:hypothetical protein